MRRTLTVLTVLLLAAFAAPAQDYDAAYEDYSHVRIVRLSLIEGQVQLYRTETGEWEQAVVNMPIRHGYALATGAGFAEVEFESGATARLAQYTEMDFTELALGDGARVTQLALRRGTASFYANLSRRDVFHVTTPHLEARIDDQASFRLDVDDRLSQVRVHGGDVDVATAAGTHRVKKNRMLAFAGESAGEVTLARAPRADEWDRWVNDRENALQRGSRTALGYANSPYRYGLADLSYYGSWIGSGAYGNCWQPWGVGSSWSPFLSGRWLHLRGVGWTWVSYEPWGWVPYHYGSWANTAYGWCWVPPTLWSFHPGRVHWLRVGSSVGWVPYCPGDRAGRPPRNLGHGVVVNTPKGLAGVIANQKVKLSGDQVDIVNRPPIEPAGPRGLAGAIGRPIVDGNELQPASGETQNSSGLSGVIGRPSNPGGEPGIVRDPQTGTFVNNPARPPRPAAAPRDASVPEPRGLSGAVGRPAPPVRPAPAVTPGRPQADRPTTGIGSVVRPPTRPARPPQPAPQATPRPPRGSDTRPGIGRPAAPRPAPRPSTGSASPRPSSGGGIRPSSPPPRPSSPPARPSSPQPSSGSGESKPAPPPPR